MSIALPIRMWVGGALRLGLAAWLALTLCGSAPAAESTKASPAVQSVELVWQDVPFSFWNVHLSLDKESEPFAREPELSGKVYRGRLRAGDREHPALALLWDRGEGKLFLDLNGNLDLTDDPEGVFSSSQDYAGSYQSFTNVHLPLQGEEGERRLAGDLALWHYGSQPGASFALRSLWQGQAVLDGREWQIGLIHQDLQQPPAPRNVYLLLRSWARHQEAFSLYDGSLQAVRFARQLFLNGRAYDLTLTPMASGALQLEFTEAESELGDASLTGSFVRRLVLEGEERVVVLDEPGASVRVPVGRYSAPAVWLQSGEMGARLESRRFVAVPKVTIEALTPAVLEVGGPLTNSVMIGRRGGSLYLSYQLVGCNGQTYSLASQDRSKPPTFTVFHQGRQVGSGQFEFG